MALALRSAMAACKPLLAGRFLPAVGVTGQRHYIPSRDTSRIEATMAKIPADTIYSGLALEKRNRDLGRPIAPHLSIYAPQVTSMLSIVHRISGAAYAVLLSLSGTTILFLPHSITFYAQMISEIGIPSALGMAIKFIIAAPITYHYFNGMRHLAWDLGKGFDLKTLYNSGYFVVAVTTLAVLSMVAFL